MTATDERAVSAAPLSGDALESQAFRRAVRRAVFKGLRRAAFRLFLVFLLLAGVSAAWTHLARRDDALRRVGEVGMRVAHPAYWSDDLVLDQERLSWRVGEGYRYQLTDRTDGRRYAYTLKTGFTGRLQVEADETRSPLDAALDHAAGPKAVTAFARTLPTGTVMDGLVVLERHEAWQDVAVDLGLGQEELKRAVVYYEDPLAARRPIYSEDGQFADRQPVTWRADRLSGYATLQDWATSLRREDDDALAHLGLPPSGEIQDLARDGRVDAVLLEDLTPADVVALLGKDTVLTLVPVNVRFDVGAAGLKG